MSDTQKIRLRVVGSNTLHCAGCERTVEFALSHIPGVDDIHADHNTQVIEFSKTSNDADLETVMADLDWIGYQVEEI